MKTDFFCNDGSLKGEHTLFDHSLTLKIQGADGSFMSVGIAVINRTSHLRCHILEEFKFALVIRETTGEVTENDSGTFFKESLPVQVIENSFQLRFLTSDTLDEKDLSGGIDLERGRLHLTQQHKMSRIDHAGNIPLTQRSQLNGLGLFPGKDRFQMLQRSIVTGNQ